MSRLRVNGFGISIDGYGAGPNQALDNPMGVGGMALHQWVLGTKTFHKMAGVATVRQYLTAGLIDELHLAIAPAVLGKGENLFVGIDLVSLGYRCTQHASSEHATHMVLTK